jgi:hypothetical protein
MTAIVVTLVITMMTNGQEYERYIPKGSIVECLSEAANVLNEAAKVHAEQADEAEIGAGCVIKINPGHPA